jgi:hypothetical protein
MELMRLAVGDVKPNPYQPREQFDEEKLQELADNIKAHGMIEPIVVTKRKPEDTKYTIVAGERRWRATKKADIKEMYAIVKDYDNDVDIKRDSLVENELRENLSNKEFKEFAESLAKSLGETYYNKETGLEPRALSWYVFKGTSYKKYQEGAGILDDLPFYKKLAAHNRVGKKGVKELIDAVDNEKINITTADKIASIDDKDLQRELVKLAEAEEFDKLSEAIKRHNIRQGYEEALSDKKKSDEANKKQMSKPQVLVKLLKRFNEWTMDIGGINELLKEDTRFMFKFTHEEQLQILDGLKPLRKEAEELLTLMSRNMERISDGNARN